MSIFKYVISERIDIFKYCRIRFTQPSAFNDPFEMQPFFDELGVSPNWLDTTEDEKQRIKEIAKEEFYSKITDWGKDIFNDEFFDVIFESVYPSYLEGLWKSNPQQLVMAFRKKVPERINKRLGVLCFTEKPDNLLMWAHYAQNHQGFVIEFDENHNFFSRSTHVEAQSSEWLHCEIGDMCGYLQKVEYSDERPANKSLMSLTAIEVFLLKSKEWEYEQEWRMFRLLEDRDEMISTEFGDIHLFSLPPDCIKGIIMGCRMPWPNKCELERILFADKRFSHVKLYEATLEEKRFALNITG